MQGLIEGAQLADRYVLTRRLGAGGMAESWAAEDSKTRSTVALKFLNPDLARDSRHRELFRKEWQISSRMMHANIARVFEYFDDDERPFFAMQYIEGDDLGALANESLDVALPPLGLLADAIRYAHGKSVVHRDIKASNVLLNAVGAPHLLDFGVAAAESGGSTVNASPQMRGGMPPQPTDDIYALGVLAREIIYGQPPTDGADSVPGGRPSGEAVPADVRDLVNRMLAQHPNDRPSAEAVVDGLAAAGYPAGVARRQSRARSGAALTDEAITATKIKPIKRSASPMAERAQSRGGSGLSSNLVYGSLGVLVVVLLGVVLLLPSWVRDDPGVGPDEEVAADAPAIDELDEPEPADGPALSEADSREAKRIADEALSDLLSQVERLRFRGIERWGGQPYLDAMEIYGEGDQAYIDRDYVVASDRYRTVLDRLQPFFSQIDGRFEQAMQDGEAAFAREDFVEAIRQYDLAVAITPNDPAAERGLERARNLEAVLDLMSQGDRYRDELALDAARLAYEKALELDGEWQPAEAALATVRAELQQMSFEARMTEGFDALTVGDFASARAAFNAAKGIEPNSQEPVDGLLQLDQEIRLSRIRTMELGATAEEDGEMWEQAVATYEALLEVDPDLQFAQEGLARATGRANLHRQLQGYIDEPDSLSDPTTMQRATQSLLGISRMDDVGPRLTDQKDQLSRLLKRAATPLTVQLVSDNATEVSVYRIGKLGVFANRELELRPGNYVAVGVRPGYRDVRLEFRVAPELDQEPIVVRCEEPI